MSNKIWIFWKRLAGRLAIIQTAVILTFFYFLVIGPFAMIIKLLRKDLLDKKWKQNKSFWKEKEKMYVTLKSAKRQF